MTQPELVTWPDCTEQKGKGPCGACAYCKRRLYGPQWWERKELTK